MIKHGQAWSSVVKPVQACSRLVFLDLPKPASLHPHVTGDRSCSPTGRWLLFALVKRTAFGAAGAFSDWSAQPPLICHLCHLCHFSVISSPSLRRGSNLEKAFFLLVSCRQSAGNQQGLNTGLSKPYHLLRMGLASAKGLASPPANLGLMGFLGFSHDDPSRQMGNRIVHITPNPSNLAA